MKTKKKKVIRHIKWKFLFLTLSFVFTFSIFIYYYSNLTIKNIQIDGNELLKDYEIIEVSGIKEYPKINHYTKKTIEKNVLTLDLVEEVKVKKNLLGKITITIKEANVLFYNRNNSTYVLSNGKETIDGNYTGIPFLVNYVKSNIYDRLIKELAKVKKESLSLISEIEYSPSRSGDTIIDETRFLLRMNDGNQVHINLINIDRLDMYALTYTAIPLNQKGILELDSDSENGYWHTFQNSEGE